MEGVGGASGGGSGGEEEQGEKMKKPLEGEIKTNKRKMKTASQLEILEKTYAVEAYPSEALRAELSVQLGLSDRQLQMWFCHRRLKDRKQPSAKRQRKDSPPALATPVEEAMPVAGQVGEDLVRRSSPFGHYGIDPRRLLARPSGVAVPRISVAGDAPAMKRHYKPQKSIAELRAIAFVEAQLGEPLREDGPILGMEFDPLPPGAFGAPIVGQQKHPGIPFEANVYELPDAKPIERLHEYQFLPQQPTVRGNVYEKVAASIHYNSPPDFHNTKTAALTNSSIFAHANEQGPSGSGFPSLSHMPQEGKLGHILPSAARDYETVPRKVIFTNIGMDAQFGAQSFSPLDNHSISTDRPFTHSGDILHMERKLQGDEARMVREVEVHEKRIRKELEKQDILRRKREEQIRKETERHDRERRKEEERLSREKQREEERLQREQRRELERREKFLQRESIRAEKLRQKEELRREKEAARQKAASERAVARRIAKESMELVEDERLELMELVASSKGLPSVLSLDFETLQNLDSYRDKLNAFPPKSVLLKRPFFIQPWRDSNDNVGNLLMVWRFLVTFADVLGIWPFTLDEFVQAFHDYDPRLLGEIHIALLRCIIKDIEDVARTAAPGLGTNQNCAANPGGGHPQIVEGAYMWGFDIRSWQHHLNPLTWPEILRQFALSAGFGPQLKNKDIDQAYCRGDDEGNDGEDVVTILRSGAAVKNAVALMQERGFPGSRRSRHRLTPGTVKFAAFHVLSFEGSKGLTILEVADKIQKSGLRDLTTSKTPEASVSAALSRDTKLFERTAPSTYCVRPAYRKDPEDAEEILSAAREKIRIFKSSFADGEGADDAERDDDFESDGAEDPEVDDLGTDLKSPKQSHNSPEANDVGAKALSGNGKKSDEVNRPPQVCLQNVSEVFSSLLSEGETKAFGASIDQPVDIAKVCSNIEKEDADIDESNPGEPWVQGLMEAEYSDLTVEERLNALVALVGVAIEGTSVRVVLEERLEAANALKKQMWAEAQLDKRRMKEECVIKICHSSVLGNKMESNLMMSNGECTEFPFVTVADKSNGDSLSRAVQRERLNGLQNNMNDLNDMPSEGNVQMQDLSTSLDNLPYQQLGHAAEKSRSQLKSLIGHRAEEIYVYRSLPLGQDRRHNRYWQFATSVSCYDPGCGRIFVELQGGQWRLIDSDEGFDALVQSLDVRGSRECQLYSMLQKIEISFKETARRNILQNADIVKSEAAEQPVGRDCTGAIDSPGSSICVADNEIPEASTSFTVELGRNETEKIDALSRYEDFEKWMWKECFNSSIPYSMKYGKKRCMPLLGICDYCSSINFLEDGHCSSCHRIYDASGSNLNISEHMAHCVQKLMMDTGSTLCGSAFPLRIRILKLLFALLEVSVPPGAFLPVWTNGYRRSWGMKLWSSSSADDLLQILTLLEGAIKKDYLSSNFGTTIELLGLPSASQIDAKCSSCIETVPVLPWLPLTTAAIALRVMELDASISYTLQEKVISQKDRRTKGFMQFPSKYAVPRSTQHCAATEASHQGGLFQEENGTNVGIGLVGLGPRQGSRGQSRGRAHGGRSQRRVIDSRSKAIKKKKGTNTNADGFRQMAWKAQPRSQRGHRHGLRSLRSRQKSVKKTVSIFADRNVPIESTYEDSSRVMVEDQWVGEEKRLQVDGAENASSSEIFGYDENGQASGDESEGLAVDEYACAFNAGPSDLQEASYIDLNGNVEDEDDVDADEDADEQGDNDLEEYINGDSDEKRFKEANVGPKEDPDDGIASVSSDFSD